MLAVGDIRQVLLGGPWFGGHPKLVLVHPNDLEHLWTLNTWRDA